MMEIKFVTRGVDNSLEKSVGVLFTFLNSYSAT